MYMLLSKQLDLLREFGLKFHEALTPDLIYDLVAWVPFWEFDDPPFIELMQNLRHLNYEFENKHGARLSPQTFSLDLESYDRPTKYSEIAERLSEAAGSRHELRLADERMTKNEDRSGSGFVEYKFQRKAFRHEHPYLGDWLSSNTILNIARNVSSLDDNFEFYGFHSEWERDGGLRFYYMLTSERERIESTLRLSPWRDYFESSEHS